MPKTNWLGRLSAHLWKLGNRRWRKSSLDLQPRRRRGSLCSAVPAMIEVLEARRVLSSVSTMPDSYTAIHNRPDDERDVCSNDTGSDGMGGSTLTATVVSGPSHGSLAWNTNSDGRFVYTPDDEYVGADSFTYTASIGGVTSSPETVTIDVWDYAPTISGGGGHNVIHDQNLVVTSPTATPADDDDAVGDLTMELYTDASHGSASFNANGTFTYTPNGGYYGQDSFSIRSKDPHGKYSDPIDINISVLNYQPTLNISSDIDMPESLENGDTVDTATSSDGGDGDTPVFSLTDPSGIFTINSGTGVITVANEDDIDPEGTYDVTVGVTDGTFPISAEVTIHVVASMWKITSPAGTGETLDPMSIVIKGTGPANETKTLKVWCLSQPGSNEINVYEGEVTCDADGKWEYTLTAQELTTFRNTILNNPANPKKGPLKMKILNSGGTAIKSQTYKFTP